MTVVSAASLVLISRRVRNRRGKHRLDRLRNGRRTTSNAVPNTSSEEITRMDDARVEPVDRSHEEHAIGTVVDGRRLVASCEGEGCSALSGYGRRSDC